MAANMAYKKNEVPKKMVNIIKMIKLFVKKITKKTKYVIKANKKPFVKLFQEIPINLSLLLMVKYGM
jgi:hypothetical protein